MRNERCLLRWREGSTASTRKSDPNLPSIPPPLPTPSFSMYFFFFLSSIQFKYFLAAFSSLNVTFCNTNGTEIQKSITVKWNVICLRHQICLFSSSFLTHAITLDILLFHVSTSHVVITFHLLSFIHLHSRFPCCRGEV